MGTMKRIGVAASRIAKDDLVLYNVFVILLSCLLSLFIFLVSAFTVAAGMALTFWVTRGFMAIDPGAALFKVSLAGLAAATGLINLAAILLNIKFKR